MALNISAWSIRNPLPSIVFSIILLLLGWISFTKLAVTRLPSADIPVISVAVSQFGAAPAELESQVTKTIEDGVSGVEGVRHISSSITDGLSLTTIQFALAILAEAALSYLGLGTQPPTPDWGAMIRIGTDYLQNDMWMAIGPGFAIFVTVFSYYMLGDALRDYLDPRLKSR